MLGVNKLILLQDEYRVQKAFLVSKLDSSWSRLLEWNTVTSVSWDVIDGHLKTSLNVHSPDASSGAYTEYM